MPLHDLGTVVINHVVFLTHLIYFHLAFAHAEPSLLVVLYLFSKVLGRRAEDSDWDASAWPPRTPKLM